MTFIKILHKLFQPIVKQLDSIYDGAAPLMSLVIFIQHLRIMMERDVVFCCLWIELSIIPKNTNYNT